MTQFSKSNDLPVSNKLLLQAKKLRDFGDDETADEIEIQYLAEQEIQTWTNNQSSMRLAKLLGHLSAQVYQRRFQNLNQREQQLFAYSKSNLFIDSTKRKLRVIFIESWIQSYHKSLIS